MKILFRRITTGAPTLRSRRGSGAFPSRPAQATLAFALALTTLAPACVSMRISSPHADGQPVILQNAAAECRPVDSFNQFYLLFGVAPIRTIPQERMFPKTDQSYRVTEEFKWYDMALSIVGGAFLSLTKNTVTVEECDGQPVFASAAQRDEYLKREARTRQDEIGKRLDDFVKAQSEQLPAALVLKNGEILGGRVKSISEEAIVLEVVATDGGEKTGSESETKTESGSEKSTRVIQRRDIEKIEFRNDS